MFKSAFLQLKLVKRRPTDDILDYLEGDKILAGDLHPLPALDVAIQKTPN